MTDESASTRTSDVVHAVIVFIAAALAVATTPLSPLLWVCLAASVTPWVAVSFRRSPPLWLFLVLAIVPVIPVVAVSGISTVLFLPIAAASRLASRSGRPSLVAVVAVVVISIPFIPLLTGAEWDPGFLYFAFGGAFGVLVGALVQRSTVLTDRLRVATAGLAEAAARDERHRIARDVHDLVAHSLTVVVLNVGGARRVLRLDPNAAERALEQAEKVCRESIEGIRGVVGILRTADGSPAVSLNVDDLISAYRRAGLPIALRVDGSMDVLPLATRIAVYRVIQEALANVGRHAPTAEWVTVDVDVDVDVAGEVNVAVVNGPSLRRSSRAGGSGTTAANASGFGLAGLAEQVRAVSGDLVAGADRDGWAVRARILLHRSPSDSSSLAAEIGGSE